ncbi:TetR/AcrR family transcriptional regulator [Streptomyces sp. GC420]|uniref:TetR/AcrR family transcriptional regulator n=1 Tax=Streptomyces sp. GC420 TaxID=2697568 RepID=UPI0014152646|nr:TetR/AcrR family transcriptional regulator [Streptomyces sp. GC420]NBM18526.1 TetR family transcriptional regulator [Streptomyces sp. GC420]
MGEERQRGRPRSAAMHQAILEAVRELLVRDGYARLSMEGVAARAGVGKPTLYRRWPSKGALVAETVRESFLSAAPGAGVVPLDTGDVEQDLRSWLRRQAVSAADPGNASLILALTAAAAENPHDAEDLYRRLTGPWCTPLVHRLRAGVDAGQLRPDADLEAVADALVGALLFQLLTGSASAAEQRAIGLLDALLTGLRSASKDTAAPKSGAPAGHGAPA